MVEDREIEFTRLWSCQRHNNLEITVVLEFK